MHMHTELSRPRGVFEREKGGQSMQVVEPTLLV
jgi:hypothetical protein